MELQQGLDHHLPQAVTEQALRESEARTRAILHAVSDAIITIDDRGTIESINPAAERLFGYPPDELVGQNVRVLMPPPYRDEHDTYLRNYLTTGQRKLIGIGREVHGQRKDGSTFPIDLAVSEVRLGERRLFTGVVHDISARKQAEEQLRFYAAQLQRRNTELMRSNQELDDFAYIASHDLKEPLRGIHNYATFLIEDHADKLDDDGRSKLETMRRLTQRMDALIDSLLEFSRAGRIDLAIRATNLNTVLEEVLDSLRISIEERSFEVRIPRPLPTVECDRVRVAEIFRNLLTNALKYNDKRAKWLEIGWRDGDSNRQAPVPVLHVQDNGIGIRAKHLEVIFRIFKRLHSRDAFGGGTGAGLTIVKKIVERHGGQIWVESEEGVGSTFFFTLAPGGEDG